MENAEEQTGDPDAYPDARYAKLLFLDDRENSLVGSIAATIGRAIVEGALLPGSDLNSVDLARRFDTSRTPVREALMLLEKEGIVVIPPRRRPHVAEISLPEIRDICAVRATLLGFVASLIARNGTREVIEDVRQSFLLFRAAHEADDIDEAFWATVRFEDALVEACGNAAVQRTLAPLRLRTLRLWRLLMHEQQEHNTTIDDLDRMVQAIGDRHAQLAAELYKAVVLNTLGRFEALQAAAGPPANGRTRGA